MDVDLLKKKIIGKKIGWSSVRIKDFLGDKNFTVL